MSLYKSIFLHLLDEDNTAGAGGVFGNQSGQGYADGDARLPSILGAKSIRKKKKRSKKKKKKKQSQKIDMSSGEAFPVQTRFSGITTGASFGSFGSMSGFGS